MGQVLQVLAMMGIAAIALAERDVLVFFGVIGFAVVVNAMFPGWGGKS